MAGFGPSDLRSPRPSTRKRGPRWVPWVWAVGLCVALSGVLTVAPPGGRTPALAVFVVVAAGLVSVGHARLGRRRREPRVRFMARFPTERVDPDEPSARMRLAARLAQRGVPAVWIAERCDMPLAMAELVVLEARRKAGGKRPEGDAPP